jgi:hypothetical protein
MGNDKLMMQQRRRALKYFVREDTLQWRKISILRAEVEFFMV